MFNTESIQRHATGVLTEYMGVAAEFLVEDALAQTHASLGTDGFNEEVFIRTFLTSLSLLLPTSFPQTKINQQILQAFPHLIARPRPSVPSRVTQGQAPAARKAGTQPLSSAASPFPANFNYKRVSS